MCKWTAQDTGCVDLSVYNFPQWSFRATDPSFCFSEGGSNAPESPPQNGETGRRRREQAARKTVGQQWKGYKP